MKPKTDKEIEALRQSGQILKEVFNTLKKQIEPGMSKRIINELAKKEILALGASPVLEGYQGFPGVICVSVNNEVVHGTPGSYELQPDDLISLDLCVGYGGMITDSAITWSLALAPTGKVRTLLKATQESLYAGIEQVKNGAHVGDISNAVQKRLLRDNLGIVEDLVGHGVGHQVHEPPEIPNVGMAGQGPILRTGMTIAIEPMSTLGRKDVFMEADNWTISTLDGSLSGHFEHTVLVTEQGYEILTA